MNTNQCKSDDHNTRKIAIKSTDPFAHMFMDYNQRLILANQEKEENIQRQIQYKAMMRVIKQGMIKKLIAQPNQSYPWQTPAYYQLSEERRQALDQAKLGAKHSDFWYQLQTLNDKIDVFRDVYYEKAPVYDQVFNKRKLQQKKFSENLEAQRIQEQKMQDQSKQSQKESISPNLRRRAKTSIACVPSPVKPKIEKNQKRFDSSIENESPKFEKQKIQVKPVTSRKINSQLLSVDSSTQLNSEFLQKSEFLLSNHQYFKSQNKFMQASSQISQKEDKKKIRVSNSSPILSKESCDNQASDRDKKFRFKGFGSKNLNRIKISEFLKTPDQIRSDLIEKNHCDMNSRFLEERNKIAQQINFLKIRKEIIDRSIQDQDYQLRNDRASHLSTLQQTSSKKKKQNSTNKKSKKPVPPPLYHPIYSTDVNQIQARKKSSQSQAKKSRNRPIYQIIQTSSIDFSKRPSFDHMKKKQFAELMISVGSRRSKSQFC